MTTLPTNHFLDRRLKDSKKSKAYIRSPKQEKDQAKRLGGAVIHGSGRGFRKGDVIVPNLARIECKATQADSFRVDKEMIGKITNAAMPNGEIPYIAIEFLDGKGKVKSEAAVIARPALESLLRRLKDAESK